MNPLVKHHLKAVSRWLCFGGLVLFVVCLYSMVNPAEAAEGASTVTLQSAFIEVIQQTQASVQAGVSFLKQEIPDVVRQLLLFNIVFKAAAVAGSILLAISIACYWWWVIRREDPMEGYYVPGGAIYTMVAGFTSFGLFFSNVEDLFKLWLAPKVWLIEYAASLVK